MNRRRFFALLMALLMLLTMAPEAMAYAPDPNHTHHYSFYEPGREPTCTAEGTHWMYCDVPGCIENIQVTDPPLGHDWANFPDYSKAPTCTESGLQEQYCTRCRETRTVDVPALGHAWSGWTVTKQPTCTESGTEISTCTRCNQTQSRSVAALGHVFGAWTATKQPTCTESGTETSTCTRCNQTQRRDIPALGHIYGDWTTTRQPTCAKEGEKQTKCSRCGNTVTEAIPTTAHQWGEWTLIREPTKWDAGIEERKCGVCGKAEQRPVYMDGTVMPGERSDNAKRLQELLNAAGFDCGKADGIVGNNTQNAIKEAEQAAGHAATGIGWVGLQEWLMQGGGKPDPASGGPQLTLAGETEMYKDAYYPNDTFSTTLRADNTGTETLYGLTITRYKYDEAVGDFVEVGPVYQDTPETPTAPGGYGALTDPYPITAEDAEAGMVTLMYRASARRENGETVYSWDYSLEFMVQKRDGDVGLYLEPLDYSGVTGHYAGERLQVPMVITNTGNCLVSLAYFKAWDSDGHYTGERGERLEFDPAYIGIENTFNPGESRHLIYGIVVTEDDIAKGAIIRTVQKGGYKIIGDGPNGVEYELNENGIAKGYESNEVAITIPLAPTDLFPQLTVAQDGPADKYSASLGEIIRVPVKVTNTGTVPLFNYWFCILDLDGEDRSNGYDGDGQSCRNGTVEGDSDFMAPGDSCDYWLNIRVTQKDVDAGVIYREYYESAFVYVKDADGKWHIGAFDANEAINSNTLEFEFRLNESAYQDANLYIEQTGPASQPDGALGETITIPLKATNLGQVPLHDYDYASRNGDGAKMMLDEERVIGTFSTKMYHGDSFASEYDIVVTQEDVDAGVIRRVFWHNAHPWVEGEGGSWEDHGTVVYSNQLTFEFPLREVPTDGDGVLKLEAGAPSQPDGALGEWIDVPLKVTNVGSMAVYANNHVMWSLETGNLINSSYIVPGHPHPLQPGLSYEATLKVFVTQKDVDAGVIEREVYYYGALEDLSKNVVSNTVNIQIPLRQLPPEVLDTYVDLVLAQDGSVGPVSAMVGDTVSVPLVLTNNGTAAARMSGWTSWYEDYTLSWHKDDLHPDFSTWYWLPAGGGTNKQTFDIKVTPADMTAGKIVRRIQESGHRWLVTGGLADPSAESSENAAVLDFTFYDTNELLIEIPLLPPSTGEIGEPKLVLSMVQQSPVKAAYADGEEITYNWTLTNIGDADCDFAGLKLRFTSTDGSVIALEDTFVGLDGRVVLSAHGGKTKGTDSITLNSANIVDSSTIRVVYQGRGYYPNTTIVCALSNEVPFQYPIDNTIWVPKPETKFDNVSVEKWEESFRPRLAGYAAGEIVLYGIRVTNVGEIPLNDVEVTDPLKGNNEDAILDIIPTLAPLESRAYYYPHMVTPAEVAQGYIENVATATWPDPGIGDPMSSNSNPVIVPTYGGTPIPKTNALIVVKNEKSTPKNGMFYQEGEEIGYSIYVVNNTDQPLYNIRVEDTLAKGDKVIGTIAMLPPHSAKDFGFGYVVTAMDCGLKSVTNTARAYGVDGASNKVSGVSSPVKSPTGYQPEDPEDGGKTPDDGGEYPFGVLTGLSLTKTETSHPANGLYYTEGETISYTITAVNTGETLLANVAIYDALAGMTPIYTVSMLHPTEARSCTFQHVVTAADVTKGYVLNVATGMFTLDNCYYDTVNSNYVLSDTDGIPDDVTQIKEGFNKVTLPGEGEGYVPCTLTLNAKGDGSAEYTKHTCSIHMKAQNQAAALVDAAATDEERLDAWKQARALWQEETDKLYEALYEAAEGPQNKAAVLNERLMFYAQTEVYGAALSLIHQDELVVAQKTAEMLQNKCSGLCYEAHTAPDHRVDSYLNEVTALAASTAAQCGRAILERQDADVRFAEVLCEELTATDAEVISLIRAVSDAQLLEEIWNEAAQMWIADLDADTNARYRLVTGDDRKIVASDRMTFANWLVQRRVLLDLMYPDSAEPAEVEARTVMNRTVDNHIAEAEAEAE